MLKERENNYSYSFKCEDDLEQFEVLPEHTQARIERLIVHVIVDSFATPADEDYVTARFLAQKGMYRAFYWSASQALEKYLKTFLLLRGISLNKKNLQGHPLKNLYQEACSADRQIKEIETKLHDAIKIHSDVSGSVSLEPVNKFIETIERYGSPDNRYNSFGIHFNYGHLFALDSFVFELRQKIGIPSIKETLKNLDKSLKEPFYAYNPWFNSAITNFPEIPNENFSIDSSMSVTTFDVLSSKSKPNEAKFVMQWLAKKMKLPQKVKAVFHIKNG